MAISSDFDISDQFSPREDDDETLWEAKAILKEKPRKYLVEWAGVDPNGKPWAPSWVNKRDCTDDLVHAFKARQRKEKERKATKKQTKSRNSTASRLSETSKASRASTSVGPSARAQRSNSRVPDDSNPGHESISHTPFNPKKRRLSKPVASPSASELDDDPPSPPRPSKKRRHNPPEASPESSVAHRPVSGKRAPLPRDSEASTAVPLKQQKRDGKSASASPRRKPTSHLQAHLDKLDELADDLSLPKTYQYENVDYYDLIPDYNMPDYPVKSRSVEDSEDEDEVEIPAVRLQGKGKDRSRTPPAPKRASKPTPAKKTVFVDIPSPKPHHNSDLISYPQTQMSSILSPGAQDMLKAFDADMPQSPSQRPDSGKTPLFFQGSSEEPESYTPPEIDELVDDESAIPPAHARARSSSSNAPRYDSYRDGEVPETQETDADADGEPDPEPEPQSPRKDSFAWKMKRRGNSKTSNESTKAASPAKSFHASPSPSPSDAMRAASVDKQKQKQKPLGPIPEMTTAQFKKLISLKRSAESKGKSTAEGDAGADGDVEDVEDLTSSIEQFSSPVKGKGKGKQQPRRSAPAPNGDEGDDEEEVEPAHARVLADLHERGAAMAEAARAEQRALKAQYDGGGKVKGRSLSQIIEQQQQQKQQQHSAIDEAAAASITMSTTDSSIHLSTELEKNGVVTTVDPRHLRMEEEESTQDIMTELMELEKLHQAASKRPLRIFLLTRDEEEDEESQVVDDLSGLEQSGFAQPQDTSLDSDVQMPAPNDRTDEDESQLDRSGADEQVDDVKAGETSDRETEPEVYIDPEISAWNAERSQILEPEDSFGGPDDEMNAMLMYPPEEPEVPVVINGDGGNGTARSRSGSRKLAEADDADVLPPTASTNNGSQDPIRIPASVQTVPAETDPKHLDAAMALLNDRSNEIHSLKQALEDEQRAAEAARARNLVLEERLRALEFEQSQSLSQSQSQDSANADLSNRLKLVEELLAAEQVALAAALQARVTAENERDVARREQTSSDQSVELFRDLYGKASAFVDEQNAANKELEKRVKIAEGQTRDGVATLRATFALREQALKSQVDQWRSQSVLLREQIVMSNQPENNRRAAEYPELLKKYEALQGELQYALGRTQALVLEKQALLGERQVLTAKYAKLVDDNERLTERVETVNEEVLVKRDECFRLEQRVAVLDEEITALKSEKLMVDGDFQVLRCGWRAEATNTPCPALCRTREDLNLHTAMHVTGALSDIVLEGNVNSI